MSTPSSKNLKKAERFITSSMQEREGIRGPVVMAYKAEMLKALAIALDAQDDEAWEEAAKVALRAREEFGEHGVSMWIANEINAPKYTSKQEG